MRIFLLTGVLFLLWSSPKMAQAQAKLSMSSYDNKTDSVARLATAITRLQQDNKTLEDLLTEVIANQAIDSNNYQTAKKSKTDSIQLLKTQYSTIQNLRRKLPAVGDSLRPLIKNLASIEATTSGLGPQNDTLKDLRQDSAATASRISARKRQNDDLAGSITKDSLTVIAAKEKLNSSPDIREHDTWTALLAEGQLDEVLTQAKAILHNAYDPASCTACLNQLNEIISSDPATGKDSLLKYQRLIAGYCAANNDCAAAIDRTHSEFNADMQDAASKELAQKAATIPAADYPWLHSEMLSLSATARHFQGSGKAFISGAPIQNHDCK